MKLSKILRLAQILITRFPIPGTTYLAKLITKLFAPKDAMVQGYISNYQFIFDLTDELQLLMYYGLFEIKETHLHKKILREGDVYIDIGANVGYYSLIASNLVGETGQVYAFEPIPENSQKILDAINMNGINNIQLHQYAVGKQSGKLTLYIPDEKINNSGWASIVPSSLRKKTLEVDQVYLDDFVKKFKLGAIQLIKLDIEGAEYEALSGMDLLIHSTSAPDILCEFNMFLLNKRGLSPAEIIKYLVDAGYKVFDTNLESFDYDNYRWLGSAPLNLLFRKE